MRYYHAGEEGVILEGAPKLRGETPVRTKKAALYVLEDVGEVWIPLSQIIDTGDDWVEVTLWWARQKDLA